MNIAKKYTSGIALLFFLVILPIGSYIYLWTGLNYYKVNKAEYTKKGVLADFSATALNTNKQLTRDDLLGNTFVLSFFDAKGAESAKLVKEMTLIQEQFQNRKDVKHLTFLSDSLNAANKALLSAAEPIKDKWYILEGNSETSARMKEEFKLTEVMDHYSPEFVLVDDSLNVRGYYNVLNERQRNKLIVHLSMVMPRVKKEEVLFKREKEK